MNLLEVITLSAVMGFSIYASYPLLLSDKVKGGYATLLTGFAVGILVFLVADIFSDASSLLYNGSYFGYGSSLYYDLIFSLSLTTGFSLLLFISMHSPKGISRIQTSFLIALGIGFQNLTEGLVFGAVSVQIGLAGVAFVILIGFIIQNVTEGFPIGSPFFGKSKTRNSLLPFFFFIGGFPTILGGGLGYYFSSAAFMLVFDGLAIGSIFFIIFSMMRGILSVPDYRKQNLVYGSIFAGFMAGLVVNLL